jgi:ribose 5-phosphate isomerase B
MKTQTIVLGADHAGFALKERVKRELLDRGCDVHDATPRFKAGDDYPLAARKVAKLVSKDTKDRGILVCGSGVGVAIAANRMKGIRAMDGHAVAEVKLAREHNDVNVLTLSGWKMSLKDAMKLADAFLTTPFSNAARHLRRVKQLG